jgi:hypothetical protein
MMEQAGYGDLVNMQGGFGGLQDPATGEVITGWQDEGYPVESGSTDANSYDAQKVKAQG